MSIVDYQILWPVCYDNAHQDIVDLILVACFMLCGGSLLLQGTFEWSTGLSADYLINIRNSIDLVVYCKYVMNIYLY